MIEYSSFSVTAKLQQGVVLDTRFGMGLDSLLASTLREIKKRELGVSGSELDGGLNPDMGQELAVVELPLAKCHLGKKWHWASTCAQALDTQGKVIPPGLPDSHGIVQQLHHEELVEVTGKLPASIPLDSGRWRRRRTIIPVTPAAAVTWRAHGDIDSVANIITQLRSIGNRRHTGEGTVISWEFNDDVSGELEVGHLHRDMTLGRPSFSQCVEQLSPIADESKLTTMRVGFRPPYWHMQNQEEMIVHWEG